MSAEIPAAPGQFAHRRLQFRAWRGNRPFWAGLYVMIGGVPIMYFPYAQLKFGQLTIAMATTAGAGSLIIGVLLVVLGFSLWFQQHVRTFAGVAAILLALVSIPVSNFGGFVVGFLFAMVGGAMAVAWVPPRPEASTEQKDAAGDGGAPGDTVSGTEAAEHQDRAGEPNDLSGTIPVNGANGRRSAD